MPRAPMFSVLLSLVLLAACGTEPPTAPAESIEPGALLVASARVVNSLADPGDGKCNTSQCTLREAITDPASTEITFAAGLSGPIILAPPGAGGGTLEIDKPLTITGPGGGLVIRRRAADPAFRILRLGTGANVTLRNLTLQNGATPAKGGGISTFGTLRLINSKVIGNSGGFGGGITNHGTLTLSRSAVAGNAGGGIVNHDDVTLTLDHSTVARNLGLGIYNGGGTLTATNSEVADNTEGGIYLVRGDATLTNVTIARNRSFTGGGITAFQARVTLVNSTVANNSASEGGGIASRDGSTFTIIKSTLVGNSAYIGGAIDNEALGAVGNCGLRTTVTITNSTITGNSSRSTGGGINNAGCGTVSLRLTNTTIARNSAVEWGGGINEATSAGGTVIRNSIVAENRAPYGPDVFLAGTGSVAARFSLIRDGNESTIPATDGNLVGRIGRVTVINPALDLLKFNGGPTMTHALLPGSPALGAVSAADCPATDQRGVPRPHGAACDMGSFERK